ncbi:lipoprotein [Pseudohongiella nitratireducens]|uniref:Lipoprotein n=1 Tax=Pseudohongiella nitratireducens TaxID=1768907 RepID=A0A916QKQ7_9GAMM|nr:TraB/GumN family protein [Pseudohongiella nitratireducens]GFZ80379.1 lipoprotein [Pseudohongiella nitratireducens]
MFVHGRSTCKRAFSLLAALAMIASPALAQDSSAQTSVWVISQGDEKVYLGGTIHLLRNSDYPLPAPFEEAYDRADELYFETDLGTINSPAFQQQVMAQLTYQDGRSLSTVLSTEAYTALQSYVNNSGLPIPMPMLESFKPGLLISTLSVLEMQKLGFTPQGVDAYFYTRAVGDGKTRGELESIEEQLTMLSRMGEGYESDYVLYSLADFEQLGSELENIVTHWRNGNTDSLSNDFIGPMREQSEVLYQELLVDRNLNWIPQIERMFEDENTELVLVGVAHMLGDDGLLEALRTRGFEVTHFNTSARGAAETGH